MKEFITKSQSIVTSGGTNRVFLNYNGNFYSFIYTFIVFNIKATSAPLSTI